MTQMGPYRRPALLVFDRRLNLSREIRGNRRQPVRRLRMLRALGHHLRRVLPFRDEAAPGHQVTALEHLGHVEPPWGGRPALAGTRRGSPATYNPTEHPSA